MPDPITARVEPPSPSRPPRPEMYALQICNGDVWILHYASKDRAWVEDKQKHYPGSHLIVIPGEEVDNG